MVRLLVCVPLLVALLAGPGQAQPVQGGPGQGTALLGAHVDAIAETVDQLEELLDRYLRGGKRDRALARLGELRDHLDLLRELAPAPSGGAGAAAGPTVAGPRAVPDQELDALLAVMRSEPYGFRRQDLVAELSRTGRFTVAQVKRILATMTFEDERLRLVELLAPRVVDPEHGAALAHAFQYPTHQRRVIRLFASGDGA